MVILFASLYKREIIQKGKEKKKTLYFTKVFILGYL